jgi:hypothetical protein
VSNEKKAAIHGCCRKATCGAPASARDETSKEEKKMRNKKLFSLFIALAFLFSAIGLGFAPSTASAANPAPYLSGDAIPPTSADNCSTYLIGEPTTDQISVTFVIEAGNTNVDYEVEYGTAFRKEMTINLTGSDPKTITSVLMAVDADPTNGLAFYDENNTAFGPTSKELKTVELSGNYSATWEAGVLGFDGWEYRISDRFPVQPTSDDLGYEGPYPYDTPVNDGDVVHFFYDFPSDISRSIGHLEANYVRATDASFDNSAKKLTVKLQGHKVYIEPTSPYTMSVFNYIDLGTGTVAGLFTPDGTTLLQTGQPSLADGTVTFTFDDFTPGKTYVVKTVPAYYYSTDSTWGDTINTAYFTQTGAYSKVTIPPAQ